MSRTVSELEHVLAPVVAHAGAELVDLELQSRLLQVTVERPDGLDLAALEAISKAISQCLDAREDLTPAEAYDLEVTTPGLERRLRRPEHFRRALNAMVNVRTQPGTDGPRRIEGELVGVDDEAIEVRETNSGEVRRLRHEDIERARTVFDWQAELAKAKREKQDKTPRRSKAHADRSGRGVVVSKATGESGASADEREQG